MDLEWKITTEDIAKVQNAVSGSLSSKIVIQTSKNILWEGIVLDKNTRHFSIVSVIFNIEHTRLAPMHPRGSA
jgi:hypothetical protein